MSRTARLKLVLTTVAALTAGCVGPTVHRHPEDHDAAPTDGSPPADTFEEDSDVETPGRDGGVDGDGVDDGAILDGSTDGDADDGPAPVDPEAEGPFAWEEVTAEVRREGRTTPVSVLVPLGAEAAPLVILLPGLQMRSAWYRPLAERIASHGFVVVSADPPVSIFSVDNPAQAADVRAVLDWAFDPAGPLASRVDPSAVAVGGHSNGGKIATIVAHEDSRVTALYGLDPVNGSGVGGYTDLVVDVVPAYVESLTIPVGLLGETTNASGGVAGRPCAPEAQNFLTFYEGAASSPWLVAWDLVGADHVDFVFVPGACGLPCRVCEEGPADGDVVRHAAATITVAFLRRHLLGDRSAERWLVGDQVPDWIAVRSSL